MSWLTDTIAGRTIMVLVIGLGSIIALGQYVYQTGIEREVSASNTESIADRLLFMAGTLSSVDPAKRDDAAHGLSGGPLELHWGREPLATQGGRLDTVTSNLRARLISKSPDLEAMGLVVGTTRTDGVGHAIDKGADDKHTSLISLPLDDGSWLNVTLARVQPTRAASPSLLLTIAIGALGIVALSVLMSRWLTRPLEQLARGARNLFLTSDNLPLPETGTREVRTLATAINDLQARIRRMVDDRTHMLAAVSHDLRTPLTRLRLRVTGLGDADTRKSIEADLNEMEAMIDATLSFLRDDMAKEEIEQVDLAAILQTLADDASDAGQHVEVDIPRSIVIGGRHLALKRAFGNLVQNALKFGGQARITANAARDEIRISIADNGPGLPTDRVEAVFEPFYRLEPSRDRRTGGYGLGLTITRSIVRAHGGDVTLSNRAPHGLEAIVRLPRVSCSERT